MANTTTERRNIDMVFCIDGTGSMGPCIEAVKNSARRFHLEFVSAMTDLGSDIDSMRIKLVVFRDYADDGKKSMEISPFYELPADEAEFAEYMKGIAAGGGGDAPENGFEALYYAMKSDFTQGPKDRQVIVLFTDDDALELGQRADSDFYPKDMVDMDGLITTWMCSSQDGSVKLCERNKRMVIFAPAGTKYQTLTSNLNRSLFEPVEMKHGLGDMDFKAIIKIIAASASNR